MPAKQKFNTMKAIQIGFSSFLKAKPLTYLFLLFIVSIISSCDNNELPGVGSIPDLTPPEASFSFAANEADYLQINFTNLSFSATDYAWTFGDGSSSTDKNPSHTYAAVGTYTVTLTASDKLNQTNTYTTDIEITEPVSTFTPEIMNPGFDIEGADAYRDGWRNDDLGGIIQITSSPIHDGLKAAKLPSDGSRIGYQLVTVEANKDYIVSFYYTLKTSNAGDVTVSILDGPVTDPALVAGATIASVTVNDQTDASTFVPASVSFNSGNSTEVAIYFTNSGEEARVDTFSIIED